MTVAWFHSLPRGWVSRRIKTISPVMRGASPRPIDDPIYFDDDGEYAWVRISDVTASDGLLISTTQRLSTLGASKSVKLDRGKLFLSIAGSVGKPCITDIKACIHDGFVYFPYLPLESQKFLYWIFEARECFSGLGKLGTQLNLNTETVGNIAIPFPDLATQRQIADFLDRETARIDLLIKKKQRLVALLGEKFQALRHTAMTRGAAEEHETVSGPNQWFDRVPKSWTVKPLRHVVLFQRGHDLPSDSRTEGKYPIYSSGGISGTHSMCSSNAPGIVTGRYGTIGRFHLVEEDYWALNTSLYSRVIYEHPKYVFYLLEDLAHIFILNSSKSAVPGVDRNDIHSELVPVPSRAEQVAIAEHLDALKSDLGTIEAKTNASIDRLKEYRSALITAAVTGQIDVTTYAKSGTPDRRLDAIQEEMGG